MHSEIPKRRYQFVFGLIAWGLVFVLLGPKIIEVSNDFFLRRSLSYDVEAFHQACVESRAVAMQRGLVMGVEFGETGWMVLEDARTRVGQQDASEKVVFSGRWDAGTKLESNIPNGKFYFFEDGSCRISQDNMCEKENLHDPEAIAHVIVFVSDAPRIYTLFFDEFGEPKVEYDDF